jgi:hypothetical protein
MDPEVLRIIVDTTWSTATDKATRQERARISKVCTSVACELETTRPDITATSILFALAALLLKEPHHK